MLRDLDKYIRRSSEFLARYPALLQIAFVLVCSSTAYARVGGGQSYSGGGSSSSSDDEFIFFIVEIVVRLLFELTIHYPKIGIPLAILIIAFIIYLLCSRSADTTVPYSSRAAGLLPAGPAVSASSFEALSRSDAAFSRVLFDDFAAALYVRVHEARGAAALETLKIYLNEASIAELGSRTQAGTTAVEGVVIGSAKVVQFNAPQAQVTGAQAGEAEASEGASIVVQFESCMTEIVQSESRPLFVTERWKFERTGHAIVAVSDSVESQCCPSCGGTFETGLDGNCPHCNQAVVRGEVAWNVSKIWVVEQQARGPLLTGYVAEQGTNYPTVVDPELSAAAQAFKSAHPEFETEQFKSRVAEIFLNLQSAWSSQKWEQARPFETDALFQTHRYWMEMYAREKLRNVLEDVAISSLEIVRVVIDGPYDAITVRIFAAMRDYTVNAAGEVVGGSRTTVRSFSEYWTFVRKRSCKITAVDSKRCPNCGGELAISMAGVCDYCGSKITSGDFGWVASRIEQDEAYTG